MISAIAGIHIISIKRYEIESVGFIMIWVCNLQEKERIVLFV